MLSIVPYIVDQQLASVLSLANELSQWPTFYMPPPVSHLGESEVHNTDKDFRVRMDMQCFKPENIKITSDNKCITVRAKHEEKQDDHGYVSREVVRVFRLPENADPKSVTSTMNDQGILNIRVDKKAIEPSKETRIPVEYK